MRDFRIQDNLILTKNKVISVFEVEPFDVALLNEQDREVFYNKIKQAINILPEQVQILVVKEQARAIDYAEHFNSLLSSAQEDKEGLVQKYISELSMIIDQGESQILKYYIVFSIGALTSKPAKLVEGIKSLNDIVSRYTGVLFQAGVRTCQLEDKDLAQFLKTLLR